MSYFFISQKVTVFVFIVFSHHDRLPLPRYPDKIVIEATGPDTGKDGV